MTPAALQSKSSTLGPRARGDELGLTAVAFSLFICFHLHLGFAFRPSEHLLAQAVHEVARARRAVRIQRVLLVLARGRCPESSSNARAHGCGIIWSLLARIHRRRGSGQRPEAARRCSLFWDNGFVTANRPQNKEHPIDATTQPPRPDPNHLRRPPPGGQCSAAPSGDPRPAPGSAGTRRQPR